jgi:hypothetical protein
MSDIDSAVEDAAERIEVAVLRVENAVTSKWTSAQWFLAFLILLWLYSVPGSLWYSKWRYSTVYNLADADISIQDKPHDCAFFASPLGEKYCHYERVISITKWATSVAGNPIVSYDDGKSWIAFDANGKEVPKAPTVKQVYVSWEKKDD